MSSRLQNPFSYVTVCPLFNFLAVALGTDKADSHLCLWAALLMVQGLLLDKLHLDRLRL